MMERTADSRPALTNSKAAEKKGFLKVVSNDGTPIAYDQVGQGPPLVLVGGAFSYRTFPGLVQLAQLLAKDFTVINYDRRGRGESGNTAPYAAVREVEDLEAVIGTQNERVNVWGLSSGAALALRGAASGLPIRRLALYEPPFLVDDSRRRNPTPPDIASRLEAMIAADRRGEAVRYFLTKGMGAPGVIAQMMRFSSAWATFKSLAHTLPYELALISEYSQGKPLSASQFGSVTVPTLVMNGEKSPAQLRNAARAVVGVLINGSHKELKGQSHNVSMKALAPELVAFFNAEGDVRSSIQKEQI